MCHAYEVQNPNADTSFGNFYDKYILKFPIRKGEKMTMWTCHEVPVRAVDAYYKARMADFDKMPREHRDLLNYSTRRVRR